MKSSPKLLIFDADGTLRWTTVPGQPCPNRPDEWRLMPKVKEKLRSINWESEARLGIASNQGGVALGYLSAADARSLIVDMLVEAIGYVPSGTAIEMCTCRPDYACGCRKPAPGMLLRIMRHFNIGARNTLYVGDLESDREAARRAGIRFMWARDFFGWDHDSKSAICD